MAKISEAQKKACKKYRKKNLEKFREYAKKHRKVKNESKTTKYIDYIDLIKEYSKTMHYAKIATELQKQIPGKAFDQSNIRLFCIANDIKCQTKQAQKRNPRLILTPEQRIIAQKERAKAYYEKNKEKILAEIKKKRKQTSIIKQTVKAKITVDKDRDLIDKIKAIAENKCIIAENIADLNISSKTIESICKKIGYFYIKSDTKPVELKPIQEKIKVKKQSKLLDSIEQIKSLSEQYTVLEMAKILEVGKSNLYAFCRNHNIKMLKTAISGHILAQERQKRVFEMLTNGSYVEDVMDKLSITHKQYNSQIYKVARDNDMLKVLKFKNKAEFLANRKQELSCHASKKPVVNNTLEFSPDNTKFVIRNTQMRFR